MNKPVKKRTARFIVSFTVEVEIPEPKTKGWLVSDAACDVSNAVTALIDAAPRRPFEYDGVTITDTVEFDAEFIEEVEANET